MSSSLHSANLAAMDIIMFIEKWQLFLCIGLMDLGAGHLTDHSTNWGPVHLPTKIARWTEHLTKFLKCLGFNARGLPGEFLQLELTRT